MSAEKEKEPFADDGLQPDEEIGADGCDASPERCESPAGDDAPPEDCSFDAMAELDDAFPVEPIPVIKGKDGLPEIVTPPIEAAFAVPFTYETTVCIEDEREYVEIFREELCAHGWRYRDGALVPATLMKDKEWQTGSSLLAQARSQFDEGGRRQKRENAPKEHVHHGWGVCWLIADGRIRPMRPLRERCQHYRRQVISNDDKPDPKQFGHQIVFRNCTARRSNGGAFMSLMGQGIYSCDYRYPPDESSRELIDQQDQERLEGKAHEILVPMFNVDGGVLRKASS
jgi:hypothetical protein